jgi:hypothetical protein
MSDAESRQADAGSGMTPQERAERQHDAEFEVVGTAPEWAMRMFPGVKPGGGQPQG